MARTIQSLERAAAVLRLLAGGQRRVGLSDIAAATGLAKATAHGLLRTLQQEGFVEQDPRSGTYGLGAELLRLGNSYLEVHELRTRALVAADDLARATGEGAFLGVLHQCGVLIVHYAPRPGDSRQAVEIGAVQPLHSSALGRALAAFDPVAHREALAGGLPAFTPLTVTGRDALDRLLELVRARGWACDVGETWDGVAAVAAPVLDRARLAVGAVGIAGAEERVLAGSEPQAHLVASVRDCARSVSRGLGAGRF